MQVSSLANSVEEHIRSYADDLGFELALTTKEQVAPYRRLARPQSVGQSLRDNRRHDWTVVLEPEILS